MLRHYKAVAFRPWNSSPADEFKKDAISSRHGVDLDWLHLCPERSRKLLRKPCGGKRQSTVAIADRRRGRSDPELSFPTNYLLRLWDESMRFRVNGYRRHPTRQGQEHDEKSSSHCVYLIAVWIGYQFAETSSLRNSARQPVRHPGSVAHAIDVGHDSVSL